jgi:hypothetical protein
MEAPQPGGSSFSVPGSYALAHHIITGWLSQQQQQQQQGGAPSWREVPLKPAPCRLFHACMLCRPRSWHGIEECLCIPAEQRMRPRCHQRPACCYSVRSLIMLLLPFGI